jgi:hypothetical protein
LSLLKELHAALGSQIEPRAAAELLVTASFILSIMSSHAATASSSKKIDIVERANMVLPSAEREIFYFSLVSI